MNAGGLAGSGDPRDWVDGGVTPVANLAATFGREPANGVEWYFPRRLTIDTNGADQMRMNDVAQLPRPAPDAHRTHRRPDLRLPDRPHRRPRAEGARRLVERARTSEREALLIDGAPEQSHLDPLMAAPEQNEFLGGLEQFLTSYLKPPSR